MRNGFSQPPGPPCTCPHTRQSSPTCTWAMPKPGSARVRLCQFAVCPPCSLLCALVEVRQARQLIIAGDLFEAGAVSAISLALLEWVRMVGLELVGVVPGNHDRGLTATELPICPDGVVLGGWRIVHGDEQLPAGSLVSGHLHPCLCWGRMRAACYLVGPGRLVLPAFSPDAAGVNVLGQGQPASWRCAVIVGEQVLDFGLVGDLSERMRTCAGDG